MMGWSMAQGSIRAGSLPGENGSDIDDEIACANQAMMHGAQLGSAMSNTDREADENSLFTGEMSS
jgi:hypothetical protein